MRSAGGLSPAPVSSTGQAHADHKGSALRFFAENVKIYFERYYTINLKWLIRRFKNGCKN